MTGLLKLLAVVGYDSNPSVQVGLQTQQTKYGESNHKRNETSFSHTELMPTDMG